MKNYSESKRGLSNIQIKSFGGNGGMITGSCHRVDIKNSSVAVDYGLFQGAKEERSEKGVRRNFAPTKDIAKDLTDILITHTHIDHSGRLPMVFKNGFTPRLLATEITAMFLEPMLLNSAEIQERNNKENQLYNKFDVEKTLKHIKIVDAYKEVAIGQNHSRITAEFLPNGHIMGSASILIRSRENGRKHNILFTGDMGKPHQSLCGGYLEQSSMYPDDSIDTLVVESTNFLKEPISFEEKQRNFFGKINEVWKRKGNPVILSLSNHRFQEIEEMLHNAQGKFIPNDCLIIFDGPLAKILSDKYKKLTPDQMTKQFGEEEYFYKTNEESLNRFNLNNLKIIDSHQSSQLCDKVMAEYKGKAIIVASGGMGEHGRGLNYLRGDFCKNPKNAVFFTCFQVEGTRGAALVRSEKVLVGNTLGASVEKIDGFTSHISGPTETFDFLEEFNLNNLSTVIITHGKDNAREAMANEFRLRGYQARIILPKLNQAVQV